MANDVIESSEFLSNPLAQYISTMPPPPIPKRTFRGKYVWGTTVTTAAKNGCGSAIPNGLLSKNGQSGRPLSPGQALEFHQTQMEMQQQQDNSYISTAALIYSRQNTDYINHAVSDSADSCVADRGAQYLEGAGSLQHLVTSVDAPTMTRPSPFYCSVNAGLSNGSISDDDRMSLENSVFEDSLTSTPVKVGGIKCSNPKRATHFSSSTIDSTNTSGYASHNERFSSSSTTAEFRSRFSSVDTQSSLESSLADRLNNSPLHTYIRSPGHVAAENRHTVLPVVPMRKSLNNATITTSANSKPKPSAQRDITSGPIESTSTDQLSPVGANQNSHGSHEGTTTVSSSTSTSSTASAISGTSSTSFISSTERSLLPSVCESSSPNSSSKTPTPPAPPLRNQHIGCTKSAIPPDVAVNNKLKKHRPPPIVYPKLHQQRPGSNLSNDTYLMSSNLGYSSKIIHNGQSMQNSIPRRSPHYDTSGSYDVASAQYDHIMGIPNGNISDAQSFARNNQNYRQDSNISSDSFSQTSSPGYNVKIIEAPLLPTLSLKKLSNVSILKLQNEPIDEMEASTPITTQYSKCGATPSSLQTIVRFHNGSPNTMSLQHQIINRRKNSNLFITNGRLKFRLFQIVLNALALLAIAGGLAAYFNAYPTIKFVNKTIINTIHVEDTSTFGKNPAPGTCLPIIVKFCQGNQIPYNYTVFPNYIGHFGQLETQVDLDAYEALVDVRCYELVSLFLCTLFVPKCGSSGSTVPPCQRLCTETMRRCGFFFDVFGLSLPDYLNCKLFKDFENPEECVGYDQVDDVMITSLNPKCDGFQCDQNRCIPNEYICDGHLDCMDQADEANCEKCSKDQIYCGDGACISSKHICDGTSDCPYGQDERNCIRLSERNGDLGKGVLEVFRISNHEWTPACVKNWDRAVSPTAVCSILGYKSVNATSVTTQKTHRPLLASVNVSTDIWKTYPKKREYLMREFCNCTADEDYPIAELTCSNFDCGKVKQLRRHQPSRRIIGGVKAHPGSWPFLAAILGGPEKIFYCAGVLISDQWVLTASHCIGNPNQEQGGHKLTFLPQTHHHADHIQYLVELGKSGNHTVIDLEDWTIQLGVTRRNSFTYSGQKVKVKTVIPHPHYNTAIAHDNDIALFQLSTRVAFHEHLLPVCLPPPSVKQLKQDQMCTVIGWGKREDKDPKSAYEPIVNEVQVPIIRRQQCDEWLDNLTVSEGMICAGYEEGGKDACQGDSGGPLLCPYPGEKDRWFVGGIVSWGIMCAHPKLPGVYANVIKYVPWIFEQMQKYSTPANEDKSSRYDAHPGGPDIRSNKPTNSVKNIQSHNRHYSPPKYGADRLLHL